MMKFFCLRFVFDKSRVLKIGISKFERLNLKFFTAIVSLFLFSISVAYSQQQIESTNFDYKDIICKRFNYQLESLQQEKVYLQLDKPYYSAGENVWFKGYVVNATTHSPLTLSNYLYVELIDKANEVISRVKIKRDSLGFSGCLALNTNIQSGNYVIRSYSYWMQNFDSDYFFKKEIFIGNTINDAVKSHITYGNQSNGKIEAVISFTDVLNNPISGKSINVTENWNNSSKKTLNKMTNNDGKILLSLSLDSIGIIKNALEVSINDPSISYKKRFFLPNNNDDFDFQFFPESGVLLNDVLQTVAFKAVGRNGLSVDVSGKLYTSKGEEVSEFDSFYKGMGKLVFMYDNNEQYYAIVKSSKGFSKRVELPLVKSNGVSIQLSSKRGNIFCQIHNKIATANRDLNLMVHSRGKILVLAAFKDSIIRVEESTLPAGIVSFSIVDSLYNTYCERLYFVQPTAMPQVVMQSNNTVYGKRKPVELDFELPSEQGKPALGSFSVSVTDNKIVMSDSIGDNIFTNLLMTSDLKGHIEDPANYFLDNSRVSKEKLDVLMLTQGWRRFSTTEVVKGKFKEPNYFMEVGQAITGKVLNISNKPAKNCKVFLLSSHNKMFRNAQTDSLGQFIVDGIDFPDSTNFLLKAKKDNNFSKVEIVVDEDKFPVSKISMPTSSLGNFPFISDYLKQSKEKYISDGGIRTIALGEVTIETSKIKKTDTSNSYRGAEDDILTGTELERYTGKSLLFLLSTMPGVRVNGDEISIRGAGQPLIMLENIEISSIDDIRFLTAEEIESISVFKGPSAAMFGVRGGNGVIVLTFKRGAINKVTKSIDVTTVFPLGYQKPSEFYVPKYDVENAALIQKSDLRTTIYWNPKLTTDSTGTIHVKFFTADNENDYSVIMEGVSNGGEIYRYVGKLKRKNE